MIVLGSKRFVVKPFALIVLVAGMAFAQTSSAQSVTPFDLAGSWIARHPSGGGYSDYYFNINIIGSDQVQVYLERRVHSEPVGQEIQNLEVYTLSIQGHSLSGTGKFQVGGFPGGCQGSPVMTGPASGQVAPDGQTIFLTATFPNWDVLGCRWDTGQYTVKHTLRRR